MMMREEKSAYWQQRLKHFRRVAYRPRMTVHRKELPSPPCIAGASVLPGNSETQTRGKDMADFLPITIAAVHCISPFFRCGRRDSFVIGSSPETDRSYEVSLVTHPGSGLGGIMWLSPGNRICATGDLAAGRLVRSGRIGRDLL